MKECMSKAALGGQGVLYALLLLLASLLSAGVQAQSMPDDEDIPVQESTYVLGPGDKLAVSVYGEEDLSFEEIRVGDGGNITYPFLGVIRAEGRTANDFEQYIRRGLIDGHFLINPEVTVRIIEYRPFYIDGEVNEPGSYPYEPGLTLRKAVSVAGGFTERASRSKINVLSEGSSGSPAQVDSLDVSVRPGDIITVEQRFF